jgi:hypothetical protein
MKLARTRAFIDAGLIILCSAIRWWIRELYEFVPPKWRDRDKARIEARIDGAGLELRICSSSKKTEHGKLRETRLEPESFARAVAWEQGVLPVWFFPLPEMVLSRLVEIPRSALPRFDALLVTEAERWTSFPIDEVYISWRPVSSDDQSTALIALHFIPRVVVEEQVRTLQTCGLSPQFIVLSEAERISARARPNPRRHQRRVVIAAVFIAAIMFGAVDWATSIHERNTWRDRVSFERQQFARQSNIQAKITNVLKGVSASQQATAESLNNFLVALGAALPASDWLTEVVVRSSQVTLRGYTAQPEILLQALEPLSRDRTVMLQGELSADKRLNRNRFAVILQIRQ